MNTADDDSRGSLGRLVVRHGVWSFVSRGGSLVLTAVLAFLLARLLGAEEFGRFAVARSAVELLAIAAAFGVDSAVLRFVGEARAGGAAATGHAVPRGLIVRSAVLLGTASAGIAAAAGVAAVLFGERLVKEPVGWVVGGCVAAAVLTAAFTRALGELARALDRPALANLSGGERGGLVGPGILAVGSVLVAVVTDLDWVDVLAVMAAGYAASAAVLLWSLRGTVFGGGEGRGTRVEGHDPQVRRPPTTETPASTLVPRPSSPAGTAADGPDYATLLRHCVPYFGFLLLKNAGERLDVPLAAVFRPPEEVGYYAAARQAAMLVGVPLAVSNLIVVPFVSRLYAAGEREKLSRLLGGASAVAALPATLAAGLVLAFTPTAVRLLFGAEFLDAVPLVRVLMLGQLAFVWTGPCGFVLTLTGRNRSLLVLALTVTAAQFTAAWLVLPVHGVYGLAVTVAAGVAAFNVGCWLLAGWSTGVWTHPSVRGVRAVRTAVRRGGDK